jgi:hypothetical protein
VLRFDTAVHDLRGAAVSLLRTAPPTIGAFDGPPELEAFRVPASALKGKSGSVEESQQALSKLMASDPAFLGAFRAFVESTVLPELKRRLLAATGEGGPPSTAATTFYYQCPPTLRLQPGPSNRYVRRHCDAEYGHQKGELNYWLPLTRRELTKTTLWVERGQGGGGVEDDHPLCIDYGEVAAFHGSVLRHHVPANTSPHTRVSLDFRVGIEGYFDPAWSMRGTKEDHGRCAVVL